MKKDTPVKKKTTSEHLRWLADRMVNVYGESPNTDFVQTTRAHADALDQPKEKPAP